VREALDRLIDEMLCKGIRYEEACTEFDRRFITLALRRAGGSLTKTARLLRIHRNTLSRKLDRSRLARDQASAARPSHVG
jgi:DNA-binding NtrC family response regulator